MMELDNKTTLWAGWLQDPVAVEAMVRQELENNARAQSVGSKLRHLRNHRGWTLEEVSTLSGLSIGYLSQLERDEAGYSTSAIETLSILYHVSPYLLQHPDVPLRRLRGISDIVPRLGRLSEKELATVQSLVELLAEPKGGTQEGVGK